MFGITNTVKFPISHIRIEKERHIKLCLALMYGVFHIKSISFWPISSLICVLSLWDIELIGINEYMDLNMLTWTCVLVLCKGGIFHKVCGFVKIVAENSVTRFHEDMQQSFKEYKILFLLALSDGLCIGYWLVSKLKTNILIGKCIVFQLKPREVPNSSKYTNRFDKYLANVFKMVRPS